MDITFTADPAEQITAIDYQAAVPSGDTLQFTVDAQPYHVYFTSSEPVLSHVSFACSTGNTRASAVAYYYLDAQGNDVPLSGVDDGTIQSVPFYGPIPLANSGTVRFNAVNIPLSTHGGTTAYWLHFVYTNAITGTIAEVCAPGLLATVVSYVQCAVTAAESVRVRVNVANTDVDATAGFYRVQASGVLTGLQRVTDDTVVDGAILAKTGYITFTEVVLELSTPPGQSEGYWLCFIATGLDVSSAGSYLAGGTYTIVPEVWSWAESPRGENTHLIIYDLSLKAWLPRFTLPLTALCVVFDNNANLVGKKAKKILLGGNAAGEIVRLFDADTDDGADIIAYVDTGWLHLGEPSIEKFLRWIRMYGYSEATSDIHVDFFRDGELTTAATTVTFDALAGLAVTQEFSREHANENLLATFFKSRVYWAGYAAIYGFDLEVHAERERDTVD